MRILVLDGGMGTTLEREGHDVSGALWGSELVDHNPDVITSIHKRYADAGADIIETSTYQMTVAGLLDTGHSEDEAKAIMRKAVALAASAASSSTRPVRVALALGPYGSSLRPGAEYSGIYPGAYGVGDETGTTALTQWHVSRLRVYAEDESTWNSISYVAFETIPNLQELHAIRRAMGQFQPKPFWITLCFPGGSHPSGQSESGLVSALVDETHGDKLGVNMPVPDGLGINCTNPAYLATVVEGLTAALRDHKQKRPALVVYPDGGAVYDPVSRTWAEEEDATPETWAKSVLDAVQGVSEDIWDKVIVGGCCKSSFEEVAALRQLVDALNR